MAKRYAVTLEEANQFLIYDPETGVFTWKRNKGRDAKAGDEAGCIHKNGYRRIGVCGALVYAHRLAWLMHYGSYPASQIDHINGIKHDNRIANLRDVSALINSQNKKPAMPNSKSGVLGVFSDADAKFWAAQIRFKGRTVRVGGFSSIEDAHAMYLDLKRRLHDGFVESK